jgi:hypothetical protein
VVVDFGEHACDVDGGFVEGADGADACQGAAELFEDGGFGVAFEAFYFAGAGEVAERDVDAEGEEADGDEDYVGGDEDSGLG